MNLTEDEKRAWYIGFLEMQKEKPRPSKCEEFIILKSRSEVSNQKLKGAYHKGIYEGVKYRREKK